MPNFKYVAKEHSGKTVSAIMEAIDRAAAIDALRKKDLIIISVSENISKSGVGVTIFGGKKKIKPDDLAMFARQLATMVDAGITLVAALDILGEQMDNKTFGAIVMTVRNDVETGSSLSAALAKHKEVFSALFINMVRAGESSGMLDDILDRLSQYLEKTSSLQKKVKSAMIYPAILFIVSAAALVIFSFKVIPMFRTVYAALGSSSSLPPLLSFRSPPRPLHRPSRLLLHRRSAISPAPGGCTSTSPRSRRARSRSQPLLVPASTC